MDSDRVGQLLELLIDHVQGDDIQQPYLYLDDDWLRFHRWHGDGAHSFPVAKPNALHLQLQANVLLLLDDFYRGFVVMRLELVQRLPRDHYALRIHGCYLPPDLDFSRVYSRQQVRRLLGDLRQVFVDSNQLTLVNAAALDAFEGCFSHS